MDVQLLMSDELKDVVSEETLAAASHGDKLLLVELAFRSFQHDFIIAGNIAGVEFDKKSIKIDARVSLDDALTAVAIYKHDQSTGVGIMAVTKLSKILFADEHISQTEYLPSIKSMRIYDIDYEHSMCVLGIDIEANN